MFVESIDKANGDTKSVVIRIDVFAYVIPGCKLICFGNLKSFKKMFLLILE